ncbi:MAG: hypothetical protein RMK19_03700 [Bacteroidia bacterium]|nr:hypothetical protein [Bacteroidia bacterium]MDW8015095.1 hypothetical protein [Bacteroidia bacterium]
MKYLVLGVCLISLTGLQAQNVGIGTASPSQRLHVAGNVQIDGALMPGGQAGSVGALLYSNGSNTPPLWLSPPSDASQVLGSAASGTNFIPTWTSGNGLFWRLIGNSGTNVSNNFIGTTDNVSLAFRTNNIERMRITTDGNVGIGTSIPEGRLDVRQPSDNEVALFTTYGAVNRIFLRRAQGSISAPSATSASETVLGRIDAQGYNGSTFTSAARIEMTTDAAGGTSTDMPGRITFHTTPDGSGTLVERMRITNAGYVGIGNSNPDHYLVVGPAAGGRHLVINDIPQARWGFATGGHDLAVQNDWGGTWTTRMIITEIGNVGIGTTDPQVLLEVFAHQTGNTAIGGRIRLSANGDGGRRTYLDFAPWRGRPGGPAAQIIGEDDNNASAHLRFYTAPPGSGGNPAPQERMRIQSTGEIFGRFRHVTHHTLYNSAWTGNPGNRVLWFPCPGGDGCDDSQIGGTGTPGLNDYRQQWTAPFAGRIVRVVIRAGADSGSNPEFRGRICRSFNGVHAIMSDIDGANDNDWRAFNCTQNNTFNRGDRIAVGLDMNCTGCYAEDTAYYVAIIWEFEVWD